MKPTMVLAAAAVLAFALPCRAQGPQPMKNAPKMTIAVSVKEEPVKGAPGKVAYKLVGSGEAAYPDGTALQFGIRFKTDQNFVIRGQGFVTAGRWEIELPPMGDNIYHGQYVCQVDFDPGLQMPGIMGKIAADKRQRNEERCEQKIGTDEMIAKEQAEVFKWYQDRAKTLRGIFEAIRTEYTAQCVTKDKAKWQKLASESQDKLLEMDMEMATWRRRKLNVIRQDVFDALAGAVISLKDYGIDTYTAQIAFEGKPPRESGVPRTEEVVKAGLDAVDQALAGGKQPEEPKK